MAKEKIKELLDDAKDTTAHVVEALDRAKMSISQKECQEELDQAISWLEAAIAELKALKKAVNRG